MLLEDMHVVIYGGGRRSEGQLPVTTGADEAPVYSLASPLVYSFGVYDGQLNAPGRRGGSLAATSLGEERGGAFGLAAVGWAAVAVSFAGVAAIGRETRAKEERPPTTYRVGAGDKGARGQ